MTHRIAASPPLRDKVARNAYSRLVQYETGRGETAKPVK